MSMTIQSNQKGKLLAAQNEAIKEENAPVEMLCRLDQQMEKKGDGGLYFMDRIWVPLIGNVRTIIMDEVHAMRYSIRLGADKMYYDLRDMYWWSGMKKDMATYVNYKMERLARLYIDKIVARHGVPVSIISNRDGIFTLRFRQTLQKAWRTIKSLEDMLRTCVIDFGRSWDTDLLLAKFSYDNNYHSSIQGAPFEALYRRKYRSNVLWAEVGENRRISLEMVQETTNKVILI
ncbi:putative reverse transcriptase domain-containing protein [Tanacetum coccineum]